VAIFIIIIANNYKHKLKKSAFFNSHKEGKIGMAWGVEREREREMGGEKNWSGEANKRLQLSEMRQSTIFTHASFLIALLTISPLQQFLKMLI
jgi:hypothetical protein